MKSIGFVALVAALAFYVGWPAYSGYEIKAALAAKDKDRLAAKIDFESLRASLRPAVAATVEKRLEATLKNAGPAERALLDQLESRLMGQIIDAVLGALVTPEILIRVLSDGANLKDAIDTIVAERIGKSAALGGLLSGDPGAGGGDSALGKLGKVAEKFGQDPGKVLGGLFGTKSADKPGSPAVVPDPSGPGYGLENIKHFGLNGPLGIAIGVARDPAAAEPDLTAEMSFVDGDWKLSGLIPRL